MHFQGTFNLPLFLYPFGMHEASWAAALGPAAGFFASFIFGYTTKHFGRKKPILFYTVPMIVSMMYCIVISQLINILMKEFFKSIG